MSELTDLLAAGFAEMQTQAGTTVTRLGVTATGVPSVRRESRALRDSGLMPEVEGTVELTAADVAALGLADRKTFTMDGKTLLVMMLETDPADPCVLVHYKRDKGRNDQ